MPFYSAVLSACIHELVVVVFLLFFFLFFFFIFFFFSFFASSFSFFVQDDSFAVGERRQQVQVNRSCTRHPRSLKASLHTMHSYWQVILVMHHLHTPLPCEQWHFLITFVWLKHVHTALLLETVTPVTNTTLLLEKVTLIPHSCAHNTVAWEIQVNDYIFTSVHTALLLKRHINKSQGFAQRCCLRKSH